MAFCTDPTSSNAGYWSEDGDLNGIESERATVYNKATAYGIAKGGTGRLLTLDEANTLTGEGKIEDKINYNYSYWFGTASGSDDVYVCWRFGRLYFYEILL